jgi:hypothetical protein
MSSSNIQHIKDSVIIANKNIKFLTATHHSVFHHTRSDKTRAGRACPIKGKPVLLNYYYPISFIAIWPFVFADANTLIAAA